MPVNIFKDVSLVNEMLADQVEHLDPYAPMGILDVGVLAVPGGPSKDKAPIRCYVIMTPDRERGGKRVEELIVGIKPKSLKPTPKYMDWSYGVAFECLFEALYDYVPFAVWAEAKALQVKVPDLGLDVRIPMEEVWEINGELVEEFRGLEGNSHINPELILQRMEGEVPEVMFPPRLMQDLQRQSVTGSTFGDRVGMFLRAAHADAEHEVRATATLELLRKITKPIIHHDEPCKCGRKGWPVLYRPSTRRGGRPPLSHSMCPACEDKHANKKAAKHQRKWRADQRKTVKDARKKNRS